MWPSAPGTDTQSCSVLIAGSGRYRAGCKPQAYYLASPDGCHPTAVDAAVINSAGADSTCCLFAGAVYAAAQHFQVACVIGSCAICLSDSLQAALCIVLATAILLCLGLDIFCLRPAAIICFCVRFHCQPIWFQVTPAPAGPGPLEPDVRTGCCIRRVLGKGAQSQHKGAAPPQRAHQFASRDLQAGHEGDVHAIRRLLRVLGCVIGSKLSLPGRAELNTLFSLAHPPFVLSGLLVGAFVGAQALVLSTMMHCQ